MRLNKDVKDVKELLKGQSLYTKRINQTYI